MLVARHAPGFFDKSPRKRSGWRLVQAVLELDHDFLTDLDESAARPVEVDDDEDRQTEQNAQHRGHNGGSMTGNAVDIPYHSDGENCCGKEKKQDGFRHVIVQSGVPASLRVDDLVHCLDK